LKSSFPKTCAVGDGFDKAMRTGESHYAADAVLAVPASAFQG
jgi:hypothetical protein